MKQYQGLKTTQKFRTVWDEIVGLFVDDQLYAVVILVWIAFVWLMVGRLGMGPAWGAITLFVGLALILVESTSRAARENSHQRAEVLLDSYNATKPQDEAL